MPILYHWKENCAIGHAMFISDCQLCIKKLINIKEDEIEQLKVKLELAPKDKYEIGEHLFNA